MKYKYFIKKNSDNSYYQKRFSDSPLSEPIESFQKNKAEAFIFFDERDALQTIYALRISTGENFTLISERKENNCDQLYSPSIDQSATVEKKLINSCYSCPCFSDWANNSKKEYCSLAPDIFDEGVPKDVFLSREVMPNCPLKNKSITLSLRGSKSPVISLELEDNI